MPGITSDIKAGTAYVELIVNDRKLVRGLKSASAKLKAFGTQMTKIGLKMARFAAAAAAPFALSVRTFVQFEDQMKAVQAVTGATGRSFDMLTAKAEELGRTTSFTAAEVAAGMLNLARAGFSPKEINAAIAGMLDLARATGTDLAEAADYASSTLRSFGLEADQMGRVADVLTATANNSAQTLSDLGTTMKYAAPIAEEFGLSIEQTSKAIGVLANLGIRGTQAGTSLRQVMLRLSDPKVQERIQEIGVSTTDAAGNLRPLADTMADLGAAMANLPSGQRLALGRELFDQRAVGAGLKLTSESFANLEKAIDNAQGTARKTAETMDSGLGGALRRLWSALEGLRLAIGKAVAPLVDQMADALKRASGAVTEFVNKHRALIAAAAKAVLVVGGIAGGFLALGLAAKVAGAALGGLALLVNSVGLVARVAGGALAAIPGVVSAIGVGLSALLSPIGLVTAAVVGVGAAFLYLSGVGGKVLKWLGDRFRGLRDVAGEIFESIGNLMAEGNIRQAAKVLWLGVKLEFEKAIQPLLQVWNGFRFEFLKIVTTAFHGMRKAWVDVSTWFYKNFPEFTAAIRKAWVNLWSDLQNVGARAKKWLTDLFIDIQAQFDDRIDAAAAKRMNAQIFEREIRTIEQDRQGELAEAKRKAALSEGELQREAEAQKAAIDAEREAALQALNREHLNRILATTGELEKARQAFRDAVDKAGKKGKAKDPGAPGEDPIEEAARKIRGGAAAALTRGSVIGTFSGQNTFALKGTGGNELKKLIEEGKKTNEHLGNLARKARRGLAFS